MSGVLEQNSIKSNLYVYERMIWFIYWAEDENNNHFLSIDLGQCHTCAAWDLIE